MKLNPKDYVTIDLEKLTNDVIELLGKSEYNWTKVQNNDDSMLQFEAQISDNDKLILEFHSYMMTYDLYYVKNGALLARLSDPNENDLEELDDLVTIGSWSKIKVLCEINKLYCLIRYSDGTVGLLDNGYPVGGDHDYAPLGIGWSANDWLNWYKENCDQFL